MEINITMGSRLEDKIFPFITVGIDNINQISPAKIYDLNPVFLLANPRGPWAQEEDGFG